MSPDDMERELRAAGWTFREPDVWRRHAKCHGFGLHAAWEELAQQRERGTVTTPVVGTEEM